MRANQLLIDWPSKLTEKYKNIIVDTDTLY